MRGPQGYYDAGAVGVEAAGELNVKDRPWAFWERRTHAVVWALLGKGRLTLDELRRAVEQLPDADAARSYYEKWAAAAVALCLERRTFSRAELDALLGPQLQEDQPARFRPGDLVRVLDENAPVRWRRPHLRTPGYIFGLIGTVERECVGAFKDPERGAFREAGPRVPLYRVRFSQGDVWEGYVGDAGDTIDIEIYQPWLAPAAAGDLEAQRARAAGARGVIQGGAGADCTTPAGAAGGAGGGNGHHHHGGGGDAHAHAHTHAHAHAHGHEHGAEDHHHHHDHPGHNHGHSHEHSHALGHSHSHGHSHKNGPGHHYHHHHHGDDDDGHGHVHEAREQVEQAAVEKEGDDSQRSRLPEILLQLLTDKGVITHADVAAEMEAMDAREASGNGARLVARAWVDPEFKARLLADAVSACAELGVPTSNFKPAGPPADAAAVAAAGGAAGAAAPPPPAPGVPQAKSGTILTAVANEPGVHNLVVCTLCSCYPISVLGLSPHWYRSRAYRARAVRDPRGLLAEFGTQLPPGTALRVHDSTADLRYIVVPERPAGTDGWGEEDLMRLVTRDSMIGVRRALEPGEAAAQEAAAAAREAAAGAAAGGGA